MLENLRNKIIRYPSSFFMRFRILWLRILGMKIGRKCWIRNISIPRNPWDIEIDNLVSLDSGVVLLTTGKRNKLPRIIIKNGCYINRYVMFDASESIEIGEDCMIGPFCYITDHDHSFKKSQKVKEQELVGAPVIIGDDVWIGASVIILKGVKIGKGAVIGAGSVVTKEVLPFTKVVGIPAHQIGIRIDDIGNNRDR